MGLANIGKLRPHTGMEVNLHVSTVPAQWMPLKSRRGRIGSHMSPVYPLTWRRSAVIDLRTPDLPLLQKSCAVNTLNLLLL